MAEGECGLIVAVDFDGVIHDQANPKPGRRMGLPLPGAKDALTRLKQDGHTVIIHSCCRAGVIADWMAYYEIPYSSIWQGNGKPQADYYVDDKAVRFTSWGVLGPDPSAWR